MRGREGDVKAQDQALRFLYDNIRQIARQLLAREGGGSSISACELVHEAFLRLFGDRQPAWESRTQLLGYAARTMRQILVSMARRRNADKRPHATKRLRLTDLDGVPDESIDLVKLDSVLERLEAIDDRQATIVEMKFFGGMTIEEIAASLSISTPTVTRAWRMARAWLKRELEEND